MSEHASVNSSRLERWLGRETVETIARSMAGWYGPPIPVGLVPGRVLAARDGDFVGDLRAGWEVSLAERTADRARRVLRRLGDPATMHVGFSSVSALIEALRTKSQTVCFYKINSTGTIACGQSLWRLGNNPVAAGAAAGAPAGEVYTAAHGSAIRYQEPPVGEALHLAGWESYIGVASYVALLYDRLWAVDKAMNSTAPEAVTGVPTRYQSSDPAAADYAGGNFLMVNIETTIDQLAHNWNVCTYLDQDGNAATLPAVDGLAVSTTTLDHLGRWFCPLAEGDTGIKALTQMQCDTLLPTGRVNFAIGHPLAFMPQPTVGFSYKLDGIASFFNLARLQPSACLAVMQLPAATTTAAVFSGTLTLVQG